MVRRTKILAGSKSIPSELKDESIDYYFITTGKIINERNS
jgi:hypothetical protein